MRFFLLLVCLPLFAETLPSADDTAIRALVNQYMEARNSNNGSALAALFTSDADQLVSTGEWRHGRAALLKGAMASSRKENGRSSIEVESVRLVGHDAAIADGRYQTAAAGSANRRRMWSTFVLERTPSGWRITAIRNMLPSPPSPK
jgi:uncharacterized protein (TIGR02246 family)